MTIVITMAGLGSRFRKAGFDCPKYEIVARDRTLFEWSLISLSPIHTVETTIVFVALRENDSRDFISRSCFKLGISKFEIIEIDQLTDGQASTVLHALPACSSGPLFIFNIDTYVDPASWNRNMISEAADGWVLCFAAEGAHWSFASVGDNGWAQEFAEKKRISNLATTGLYHFKSATLFEEAYRDTYLNSDVAFAGEKYVAPIYNSLIGRNLKIGVSDVPTTAVIPLGTPDELNSFVKREI